MKVVNYFMLVLVMVNTAIFVYLALQGGRVIQWGAAAANGLMALLILYRIVLLQRQKVTPSSDSK
jgi:hypothetical protein